MPEFVYRGRWLLTMPDPLINADFANQDELINYYKSLTKTEWFTKIQSERKNAQVKDLCAHFIKSSQTEAHQAKKVPLIVNQCLRTGENEVFNLPFRHFRAVFTNQRLIVTDKSFNLLSSDDYQDITHISFNWHNFKIFAGSKELISLERYWPLVPVLETVALIAGLNSLCLPKKSGLSASGSHAIVNLE